MTRGGRAAPPVAGEDVATRVTLNYALGNLGGRQKSWMNTGPGQLPTVTPSYPPPDASRKRGSPRQYPEEYVDAEPRQAPTGGAAREQPPSNSTSPQLANVLSHPANGRALPSPTAVFPSPSPSEDTNLDYYALASYAPARARQGMGDDQQGRPISLDEASLQGARQEAAAPKRPAAGTSPIVANKRTRPSTAAPPSRTSSRLTALEQAAKQMDWDYMITHLFYCLLSLNKAELPDSIRNNKNTTRTESFLSEVLDHNRILIPDTQAFFVRFPVPLQEWARLNPTQYHIDVSNFNDLMNRSGRYFDLRNQCDQRDLPPSMHELADDLGIRSRQLQTIVFTAAVRRLWFKHGLPPGEILNQYELEALRSFSMTQETFYRRRSQVHDLQRERELEMRYWTEKFRGLRENHVPAARDALHGFRAIHQVPVLASQHSPTTSPHPRQPQRTLSGHNHQHPLVQPRVYPDPIISPHSAQAALPLGRGQPQGRPRVAIQQPRPQLPRLQRQSQLSRQPRRLLLPPAGHQEPQQHMPNPARFALHQAHLRSPTLHSRTRERLYLYVQDFLGKPQRLMDARNRIEKWTFTLSPEQMATISKNDTNEMGGRLVRIVDEKSSMLRLRCVKWRSTQDFNPHRWATSDTSWIPYSFFQLNRKPLEQRKKLHYGRDLPIDLTSLVKEGENVLEMSLVRAPENQQFRNYLIAIEILGVRAHDALMQDILTKQHVSAATTKQRIRDKLTGTADDEIAVVNSTLNVTLFDPFSLSKICDVPVRSRACDHFDCFDLETFLSTRKRNAECTVPDNWKCPICNGDARPHLLVVDGFMQEVRSELEKQGLLKTRAIIMSEDGSWKPKPEVREGVADHDDDVAPAHPNGQKPGGPQKLPVPQAVEVIDLGDSDDD
ncbi:hypothetical protein P171DRAFT_403014 [Karstenula rhodostoma CBS 690.94]|uniref:SP-RING-type domain-containing protein n=1 Tax=Karstenula rhodostoma CBS 690.94 TaxID=1392251 RepID=A0A9P4PUN8_9PLEO|nr:hypothetical protein P171DRAFT_403014 [Karstenula rhodostoma CBS 690.94]